MLYLVFKVLPSQHEDFFWTVAYRDIVLATQMYVADKQYGYIQDYENLCLLAKGIFGSQAKSDKGTINTENVPVLSSASELASWMARLPK